MENENTTGGPLTAKIGEQLGEKGHLDEARERAEAAVEAQAARVEPKGAGERSPARPAGIPVWVKLALAAVAWMLLSSAARGVWRRLPWT